MNIFYENNLYNYINNYETNLNDKRERGSIFTNTELIYKMIKKLPNKIWVNPNLKWLDPGCGIGNFLIVIFFKLMKNLPINNEEDKRRHIIENMLYFVELNETYINILKNIFCYEKYKLNIFQGSFVYLHTLQENINTFNETEP